jgi:hypothetical protein
MDRRRGLVAGLVAAAVLSVGTAVTALASDYSTVPRTGPWHGQTDDGVPFSFTLKKEGHRLIGLDGLSTQLHVFCEAGGNGPPLPAGTLSVSFPGKIPVDGAPNDGARGEIATVKIASSYPGVTGPVTVLFGGRFLSHHQYPPPGKIGGGAFETTFYTDAGDYCGLSTNQDDSGVSLDSQVGWSAHPGH